MRNLKQVARETNENATYRFVQRAIRQTVTQVAKQRSTGFYVGYDADRGQHRIKLLNNRTVFSNSITNAGQQENDRLAVSVDGQTFKSMPRSG